MGWLSILLVVLVLGAACQSLTGQRTGEWVDDKTITAEVKAKLVADRAKNLTAVDVDTVNNVVYLKGNVRTERQKEDAETLARTVRGVKEVVNNLQIAGVTPTR